MAKPRPPICTECGDVMAREWVELDGCWVRAWLCMCSDDEKKPEESAAWVRHKRHRNTEWRAAASKRPAPIARHR